MAQAKEVVTNFHYPSLLSALRMDDRPYCRKEDELLHFLQNPRMDTAGKISPT